MQGQAQAAAQKKYVLIAEDDLFYAQIFKDKLSHAGFNVEIAANGEEALQSIRDKRPDVFLLDLLMPVKDGFEVLKELRDDESLKDLKVIVISTLSEQETIDRCKDLGVVKYLPKTSVPLPDAVEIVKQYLTA